MPTPSSTWLARISSRRSGRALFNGLPARLVVVNTASAAFPFLERLAGPRRVVISATDSAAQRFDTVFPEFFIRAFEDTAADIDKNGRVSIWEAFAATTASVRRYYQQQGTLATERGLLDDNGDGVGHESVGSSDDGKAASSIYLDEPTPGAPPTDEVLVQLLQQQVGARNRSGGVEDPTAVPAAGRLSKRVRADHGRACAGGARHPRAEGRVELKLLSKPAIKTLTGVREEERNGRNTYMSSANSCCSRACRRRLRSGRGCEVASTSRFLVCSLLRSLVLTGPRVARREQPTMRLWDL